jgi:putative transposase
MQPTRPSIWSHDSNETASGKSGTLHSMGDGYCESLNGSMRDELMNGEIFYILAEAQILIEAWRTHYNTVRPHSSLGYRPPAPEAAMPPWLPSGSATLHLRPAMAPETVLH